jgi:hypothetical protein
VSISNSYIETDIIVIATQEYKHHPLANLIDYYKLFFQAYYGQGHFVSNEVAAKLKLEIEMQKMQSHYHPYIQDISNRNGLYRVSLDTVKKQIVSLDDFLMIFLHGQEYNVIWQNWTENWMNIQKMLLGLYPRLNDKQHINLCREVIENKAMISHSDTYKSAYDPHYRVMHLSEFELIKLQKLKECL